MTLDEAREEIARQADYIEWLEAELGWTKDHEHVVALKERYGVQPQAARLLLLLAAAKGRCLTRTYLADSIDRNRGGATDQMVNTHVCRIRKAMGADTIENVWSLGYRITPTGLERVSSTHPR